MTASSAGPSAPAVEGARAAELCKKTIRYKANEDNMIMIS
jgi:hypothetical protein